MIADLISRQSAIDVVRKCNVKEVTPAYMLIDKAEAMTELMMLPSAQPEIIRCKDCKRYDAHNHRCKWWNHGMSNIDWCSYAEPYKGEQE